MTIPTNNVARWSSSWVFVLAAAGVATGLGSVWRLPGLTHEYGGGAFLLVYVLAMLSMGLPVLVAQLLLGRGVRADLVRCVRDWAVHSGQHRAWRLMGYLALAGAAIVLSYYSVIAGWSLAYLVRAASGALTGVDAGATRATFLALVGDPEKGLAWHTIFMVATVICVSHGVRRGLERTTLHAFLLAAVALLLMLAGVAFEGHVGEALGAMLRPDFAALGWRGALEAVHQAFFGLSLGVGVMIAFGVYLRDDAPLMGLGLSVLLLNIMFTLLAGVGVGALLAGADMTPSASLQLIFETVPAAAAAAGDGWTLTLFFTVLLLVALTTTVGLMEPLVIWLRARLGMNRIVAAASTGLVIWLLGLVTLLSFNLLADARLFGLTPFELLSRVSSRLLLPLVGLLTCLFVGRYLPPERLLAVWGKGEGGPGNALFSLWHAALRYPARIGMILVLLYAVGLFTLVDRIW